QRQVDCHRGLADAAFAAGDGQRPGDRLDSFGHGQSLLFREALRFVRRRQYSMSAEDVFLKTRGVGLAKRLCQRIWEQIERIIEEAVQSAPKRVNLCWLL